MVKGVVKSAAAKSANNSALSPQRRGIGIFGGTFDPVHIAHLRMALEMRDTLALDHVRLVPSHRPPHRPQPVASSTHRVAMLQLAVADCDELVVDTREVARDAPSYMVDTLLSLREEVSSDIPFVLGMGADAFADLHTWHRWLQLFEFASIAVFQRPGARAVTDAGLLAQMEKRTLQDASGVNAVANGAIVFLATPVLEISATDIRERLSRRRSAQFLLRESVHTYIHQHHLYQTL